MRYFSIPFYRAKVAFTLAEVLITLAIIGVVAAITIPSLNNNINKQDTISQVKKAYSMLSQATESIKIDCGGKIQNCLTNPDAADSDTTATQEVANLYKAKLQINKECPTSSDTGCFANITYKTLSNTSWGSNNLATAHWLNNSRFSLTDGMAVGFDWQPGASFNVWVDINGLHPPNQAGKDLFLFYYYPNKNVFKPYGDGADCITSSTGTSCAFKILREGEISYY